MKEIFAWGAGIIVSSAVIIGGAAKLGRVAHEKDEAKEAAKTQHVMYVPNQVTAYFTALNKNDGYSCKLNFEDGKKHPDRKYYPSIKRLGDCAQIAFHQNQMRKASDRGISFHLNANAKENSYVGIGICDFREKTFKPYCFVKTATDRYFLETP